MHLLQKVQNLTVIWIIEQERTKLKRKKDTLDLLRFAARLATWSSLFFTTVLR